MALSQQEFEKLKSRLGSGTTSPETPSQGGFISNVKEAVGQRVQNIKDIRQEGLTGVRQNLPVAGQVAGGVGDVLGETLMSGLKIITPKPVEKLVASGVQKVFGSQPVQDVAGQYEQIKTQYPEATRAIESIFNIGSLLPVASGAKVATKVGGKVLQEGAELAITKIPRATEKLITMTKEGITPVISKEKAIGEVLQGTTQDIKKGTAGLSLVDTKGIKTQQQLYNAIDSKIPEFAKVVDNEFAQDTTKKLLNDLMITKPTKAGGTVSVNYVDNALNQLAELYTKTGDAVKQADIEDLINIAKTDGLNKLEVNDIARTYGQEFGEKAFNKMGDPLTSINAQMFQNTRKGVKEVARSGLTSDVAIKADEAMSKLYDTRALVKKNVEAVNKLMNRIEERGLVEKIGYNVSKYADILTGGSLRGFIGGILPRGAGYKTLNALDLEALLERNLKIINEATKAKTPSQFKEITSQLLDRNSSVKNTLTNEAKNINQVTKTGASINNANKTNSIIQDTIPLQKKSGQGGNISISGVKATNIHPEDANLMKKVIKTDKINNLSSSDFARIEKLAERFNISMDIPFPQIKKKLNDILQGKVKVKGTLLPGSLKKGATVINPLTVGAGATAVGAGGMYLNNKK